MSAEGDTSIANSTLAYNNAGYLGGAIQHGTGLLSVDGPRLHIDNSTISHNSAWYGGGVASTSLYLEIDSTTFEMNAAYTAGAHLNTVGGAGDTATNSVFGTPIAGTACTGVLALALTGTGNFDSGNTCGFDPAANVVDGGNPGLGPLVDNGGSMETHLPGLGSALIDRSFADAGCRPTDQRGVSRPRGRHCDIGAVER